MDISNEELYRQLLQKINLVHVRVAIKQLMNDKGAFDEHPHYVTDEQEEYIDSVMESIFGEEYEKGVIYAIH